MDIHEWAIVERFGRAGESAADVISRVHRELLPVRPLESPCDGISHTQSPSTGLAQSPTPTPSKPSYKAVRRRRVIMESNVSRGTSSSVSVVTPKLITVRVDPARTIERPPVDREANRLFTERQTMLAMRIVESLEKE